jgi:Cu+-exporting ATPase
MVGTGFGAKHGILIRGGGEAFEEADRVDIVCFDKTGTLTEGGDLKVDDAFFPNSNPPIPRILSMVKAAESASSHPLAKVLVTYCEDAQAPDIEVTQFEEVAGRGVKARFGNTEILVGSETFISEHHVALSSAHTTQIDGWRNEAKSVVVVASREVTEATYALIAGFSISDALRKEAPATVERLKDLGVSVWMISGDNQITCKAIARRVGIPENNVIAGVLPHEKVRH